MSKVIQVNFRQDCYVKAMAARAIKRARADKSYGPGTNALAALVQSLNDLLHKELDQDRGPEWADEVTYSFIWLFTVAAKAGRDYQGRAKFWDDFQSELDGDRDTRWSTDTPDQPGWYWVREQGDAATVEAIEVFLSDGDDDTPGGLCVFHGGHVLPVSHRRWEWHRDAIVEPQ